MAGKQTEQQVTSTPRTMAFKSEVATVTNACVESTRQMLEERGVTFDEYSKQCVIAAMGSIYSLIHNQGLTPNDINAANLQSTLLTVAALKLNTNSVPRECYFQIRSVNVAKKGQKDIWEKQIEMGLEGDGNDRKGNFPQDIRREPVVSPLIPVKTEGIPSELADTVIRIFDLCGYYGIDLETAILEKMKYNKVRPYRHGGKII